MSNPIYEQFGKGDQFSGPGNMIQRFEQFKKNFAGNPQQIVQNMLNSGQITQEQFNRAAAMANQWSKLMK